MSWGAGGTHVATLPGHYHNNIQLAPGHKWIDSQSANGHA